MPSASVPARTWSTSSRSSSGGDPGSDVCCSGAWLRRSRSRASSGTSPVSRTHQPRAASSWSTRASPAHSRRVRPSSPRTSTSRPPRSPRRSTTRSTGELPTSVRRAAVQGSSMTEDAARRDARVGPGTWLHPAGAGRHLDRGARYDLRRPHARGRALHPLYSRPRTRARRSGGVRRVRQRALAGLAADVVRPAVAQRPGPGVPAPNALSGLRSRSVVDQDAPATTGLGCCDTFL